MAYDPVYQQPVGQNYPTPQPQPQHAVAPPQPVQQPMAAPQPPQASESPWKPFEWMPLPIEAVQQLLIQLEQACQQKVSSDVIVQGFLDNYPVGVLLEMPKQIKIERLIETIRLAPATKDSVLASGRGRRFLQDIWAKVAERAEELAKQTAAKPVEQAEANDGE